MFGHLNCKKFEIIYLSIYRYYYLSNALSTQIDFHGCHFHLCGEKLLESLALKLVVVGLPAFSMKFFSCFSPLVLPEKQMDEGIAGQTLLHFYFHNQNPNASITRYFRHVATSVLKPLSHCRTLLNSSIRLKAVLLYSSV